MTTSAYWGAVRRQWQLAAIIVLVAVGAALIVTASQDKRYRSTTQVFISGTPRGAAAAIIAAEVAAVGKSAPARTSAIITANQRAAVDVRLSHPAVDASATGPLVTLSVTADSADAARALAAAYPAVLRGQLAANNPLLVTLTVVEPADRPAHPTQPRPVRNILLGLLAGLVVAGAAASLLALRRRPRREVVVEPPDEPLLPITEARLLGVIPSEHPDDRLVLATRPDSVRAWEYGAVVAAIDAVHGQSPLRSLLVASALPRDGRSSFVANLALGISRTGRRVVAVDADLRHPTLAAIFNLPVSPGLSDVLTAHVDLPSVVRPIPDSRLSIVPGGAAVAAPDGLLAWPAMQRVVQELLGSFDVVVVDGPSVGNGADVLMFGAIADGLVLLARPGPGAKEGLRSAVEAVGHTPVRLLGVVANAVDVPAPPSDAEVPPDVSDEQVVAEVPAAAEEPVVTEEPAVTEEPVVAEEPASVEQSTPVAQSAPPDDADGLADESAPFLLDELLAESEPVAELVPSVVIEPVQSAEATAQEPVEQPREAEGALVSAPTRPRFLPPPPTAGSRFGAATVPRHSDQPPTPPSSPPASWPQPNSLEQPAPTFGARNRWGRRRRKDHPPSA